MAGRFLILTLTESFYGKEDIALAERLLDELPGILLWALQGWTRLHDRGKFVVPESSRESENMLLDLLSPVSAFLREYCVEEPTAKVTVEDLFNAWLHWCEQEGRTFKGTRQVFGQQLKAARPSLKIARNARKGFRFYRGLRIRDNACGDSAAEGEL